MSDSTRLLLAAAAGVLLLLYAVLALRLQAFIALLLASLVVGLGSGMHPEALLAAVQTGMGNTLGFIALVVGLGSMLGQMLQHAGGAQLLAQRLVAAVGIRRSAWALCVVGFLVSIPVFFDVGLVVLMPVVYGLTKQTNKPIMYFALPLMAGLVTTHAFVPPTPGPMLVAHELGAKVGHVAVLGAAVGIPSAVLAGPVLARWISGHIAGSALEVSVTGANLSEVNNAYRPPALGLILALILGPLGLMVAASVGAGGADALAGTLTFVGHPIVALLLAVLASFYWLGSRRGLTPEQVSSLAAKALEPAGIIILVTGAGGVLKQIMVESKVGEVLAATLIGTQLPLVVVAFALAALVRIMQGSATVAMVAASALLAPLVTAAAATEWVRALLVIAVASGATFMSHVNDSGFWLVSRYLGLTVGETLRSWTVLTCAIGTCGLLFCLVVALFL